MSTTHLAHFTPFAQPAPLAPRAGFSWLRKLAGWAARRGTAATPVGQGYDHPHQRQDDHRSAGTAYWRSSFGV